jgi:glycosyltransferase involved in cell wall biosynthesis
LPSLRITLASAHDRLGGAAVAAARLRDGLLAKGHAARMFVQNEVEFHPTTVAPRGGLQRSVNRMRSDIDSLPLRRMGARPDKFSISWLPRAMPSLDAALPADIVHLHWTNAGFLSVADIGAIRQPVVWTLHDMWAFTGGCQYDANCGRYAVGCGSCPLLGGNRQTDLSRRRFAAKRRHWAGRNITVVAPSRWLAREARRSPVLEGMRIEVIRNGLDTTRFKPLDRQFAREALGLPRDGRLVLFGAMNADGDPRKGYDLLQQALALLADSSDDAKQIALVVFGSSAVREETTGRFRTFHVGHLNDEISLALLYAACDVFAAPSRQDNLPNTVAEALACGTPCVAFDIGGMPDMIEHRCNGYLAQPFEPDDFARGILYCLGGADERGRAMSAAARAAAVEGWSLPLQTERYVKLYREVLSTAREHP